MPALEADEYLEPGLLDVGGVDEACLAACLKPAEEALVAGVDLVEKVVDDVAPLACALLYLRHDLAAVLVDLRDLLLYLLVGLVVGVVHLLGVLGDLGQADEDAGGLPDLVKYIVAGAPGLDAGALDRVPPPQRRGAPVGAVNLGLELLDPPLKAATLVLEEGELYPALDVLVGGGVYLDPEDLHVLETTRPTADSASSSCLLSCLILASASLLWVMSSPLHPRRSLSGSSLAHQ